MGILPPMAPVQHHASNDTLIHARELIREITMSALAIGTMGLLIYFVAQITQVPIPEENKELAFAILGILGGTMAGGIFGAYFGVQLAQSRQARAAEPAPGTVTVTPDPESGTRTTVDTPTTDPAPATEDPEHGPQRSPGSS